MFVLSDMSMSSLHQYDEVLTSSCIGGMAPVHLDDDDTRGANKISGLSAYSAK